MTANFKGSQIMCNDSTPVPEPKPVTESAPVTESTPVIESTPWTHTLCPEGEKWNYTESNCS